MYGQWLPHRDPDTRSIHYCLVVLSYNEEMNKQSAKRPSRPVRAATADTAKRETLGRQAWLEAAKRALIEEGTAGVEINKLAKRLGSSRGGFYWFFANRQQLLDELAAYWAETSTTSYEKILQKAGRNGMEEYLAIVELWVGESDYDPKWDGAIRDWARTSDGVRKVVAAADRRRIGVLEQIFKDMGYEGKEAHVRARIMYYHQVGYYALGIQESRKERRELLPYYQKVLTGRSG
jgi:AcrR family transcriptional regulator